MAGKVKEEDFLYLIFNKDCKDFSKMFKNDSAMFSYIVKSFNKLMNETMLSGDRNKLLAAVPEFSNKNMDTEDYIINFQKFTKTKTNYDKNLLYMLESFNEKAIDYKEKNDILKDENKGKKLFKMFKSAILEGETKMAYHSQFTSPFNVNYNDDYKEQFIENAKSDVTSLINGLKDCDKTFRGSSDEYKEIQKELKSLKSLLDEGTQRRTMGQLHRTFMASVKAIAEKADRYVEKRRDRINKYAVNDYKTKRVITMSKVAAMLDGLTAYVDKVASYEYTSEEIKNSNNDIIKDLGKHTFSMSRFRNIRETMLGESEAKIDNNVEKSMKHLLAGEKISFKAAEAVREELTSFEKCLGEVKETSGAFGLQLFSQNLASQKSDMAADLITNATDDAVRYQGKVTGNLEVDHAIMEYKIARCDDLAMKIEPMDKQLSAVV